MYRQICVDLTSYHVLLLTLRKYDAKKYCVWLVVFSHQATERHDKRAVQKKPTGNKEARHRNDNIYGFECRSGKCK